MRNTVVQTSSVKTAYFFRAKDPGSALTHFIGFVMALFATFPLLIQASMAHVGVGGMVSLSVFMLSMLML